MSAGTEHSGLAARGPLVRTCAEVLGWWLVCIAVWMASLSAFTAARLAVSIICTLPCAIVARPARHANGEVWRFRIGWWSWGLIVLRDIPVRAVKIWLYVLFPRRRHAELVTLTLPDEDDPTAAGRRGIATLSFTATPATVVCNCSARKGTVLLHRIGRRGRLEESVRR